MRKESLVFIILCTWWLTGSAQTYPESPAHSYFSLHNYSKQQSQLNAAVFNPAAFGSLTRNAIFIYSEQRFLLKELSTYRFGTAIKTNSGVFGLEGSYEGQTDYRHVSTTLNYGRQLNEQINIGLGFEYSAFNIKGYADAGLLSINAGTIIKLTEQSRSGFAIKNIPAYRVNQLGDKTRPGFLIALGYDFSDNFYSAIQIEKIHSEPNDFQMLLAYKAKENLLIKGGLATKDPVYFGGISFQTDRITFDIMSSYHPYLGITPGLSIQFDLGKKNGGGNDAIQ